MQCRQGQCSSKQFTNALVTGRQIVCVCVTHLNLFLGTRFGMERGEFGVPRMVENPLVAMGYGEMDDATNQDAAGNNAETPVDESATALPYRKYDK